MFGTWVWEIIWDFLKSAESRLSLLLTRRQRMDSQIGTTDKPNITDCCDRCAITPAVEQPVPGANDDDNSCSVSVRSQD